MEKEFIPYELALELKELGFDESCLGWFKNNELTTSFNDLYTNPKERGKRFEIIKAILYQQAFRWFREKYNLKFHIREDNWNNWCSVYILISDEHERVGDYLTYEEAELECLKKLIQIIKNK